MRGLRLMAAIAQVTALEQAADREVTATDRCRP